MGVTVPKPEGRGGRWAVSSGTPRLRLVGSVVALGATYAALSHAVTVITAFGGSSGTTFWPAAGVTVAVLLRRPRREWVWFLGAVAGAEFALDHWASGLAWEVSIAWAAANAIEPMVGASLLLRGGRGAPRLTRSEDLVRFLAYAVLVGPIIGALVGAGSATALDFYPLWPALPRWFVGDAVGALVLGPMVLLLLSPGERSPWVKWGVLAGWLTALSVVVVLMLAPSDLPWGPALPFLLLPIPAVIGFLAGPPGAVMGTAIVALGVNAMTAAGYGPFSIPDEIAGLVEAQAFVAMTAATTLIVSSLRSDLLSRVELDALKTVYLQTVAHDIRNPLAAIGGLAKVVEEHHDSLSAEARVEILRRVGASCDRLDKMVSDLLAEQRLQMTAADRRPTDVRRLITDTLDRIDLRGHPIEHRGGPVTVAVDPLQVERIIENLVSNAVRYTPAGTPIRVTASVDARGLLLTVDDAGPGVPDDLKEDIFRPFVQAGTGGKGTGLGLALVAHFAERHDGRAWVQDRDGGGASFRVLLPHTRN